MRSTTTAQKNFAIIPKANIQRSSFNRSHGIKTTFDAGLLIPIYRDEALPGDTFNCNLTSLARLSTPIYPLMDNMYIDTFWFSIPVRLLWDNWQKFNGEQVDPGDSTSFTVPQVALDSFGAVELSLSDYLGLPVDASGIISVSAFWHRAYALVWNEWFRDENLQDSILVNKDDGPDAIGDVVLQKRGKRHDYFTSCLPFPQKGTAVELPLGTSAPIVSTGDDQPTWRTATDAGPFKLRTVAGLNPVIWDSNPTPTENAEWVDPKLEVDLSTATAATINELRQAFAVQKIYERDARGGTRYTEVIRAHFGVTSDDARLQRSEYLGGGSMPIDIVQVEANTEGTGQVVGNLAGYGKATNMQSAFTKSFTEHCVLLGLVSLRADLNYQQGIPREFSRSTRWDFFWPALAQIGEQAVFNREIFGRGVTADALIFGYQERYAEYRYKQGTITGLFRSDAVASLDAWHLAQDFSVLPVLNSTFIEENPPIDRVIAVPAEPHVIYDGFINLICARPMPTYGVPGNIDRF